VGGQLRLQDSAVDAAVAGQGVAVGVVLQEQGRAGADGDDADQAVEPGLRAAQVAEEGPRVHRGQPRQGSEQLDQGQDGAGEDKGDKVGGQGNLSVHDLSNGVGAGPPDPAPGPTAGLHKAWETCGRAGGYGRETVPQLDQSGPNAE